MTWFDITWHGLSWLDMAFHGLTGQHMCTPELTIWETRGKLLQSAHLSLQYEKQGENCHKVHTWADNMRNEGIIAMTWLDMVCHDLTWRFMAWQDNTCAHLSWQYEKWRDNRHDMNWHDLTFVSNISIDNMYLNYAGRVFKLCWSCIYTSLIILTSFVLSWLLQKKVIFWKIQK